MGNPPESSSAMSARSSPTCAQAAADNPSRRKIRKRFEFVVLPLIYVLDAKLGCTALDNCRCASR